ncbi:E3 ubiquitin-protein ligase RNF31 [Bagarius yarrelli]|uniref:E3 ubiquitin-protein ligase RNF31 n=1 Tax=Bagarius yarrelli TaxID=175774 RepID=A0A556U6K2_BAGYA|nr:E3 ubiquitin-protein ligase RNF31 [Bagarius yarrelli]
MTLPEQLDEARSRAEACLSSAGSVQDIRNAVSVVANVSLPPSAKYRHIAAETMLIENSAGSTKKEAIASLQKLSTALNILEKYGSNLTNRNRPKYWRTVKHNNPVFKATVDAIHGGRAVLSLYGYTNQQLDGLSFPDDITDPDIAKVASVTLEVMSLRTELDMLVKDTHPHPEFFERIIPSLTQKDDDDSTSADAVVISPSSERPWEKVSLPTVSPSQPSGLLSASAATLPNPTAVCEENCSICGIFRVAACCTTCSQRLCLECDRLYHSHPAHATHTRVPVAAPRTTKTLSASLATWQCSHCTMVNTMKQVLCNACERPRLAAAAPVTHEDPPQPSTITEWQCKSCTVVNSGSSILCEVCERPRLATRPPVTPSRPTPSPARLFDTGQWICQFCTYANHTPSPRCEMCDLGRSDSALSPSKPLLPSPTKDFTSKSHPVEDPDLKRQKLMRDEGLKLIKLIREGEMKGVSPEEVYTSLRVSGGISGTPFDWLKTELPHRLDEICAMAASFQHEPKPLQTSAALHGDPQKTLSPLSRAEAKQAWLTAGGDSEKAARQALRDRMVKRPLLEPFHKRMWSDGPEPTIDIDHPDKQRVCRRLLAMYNLPSWGRCELALSLLRDPGAPYTLEDVVQAMQSLTSCQCSVCCDCFKQHFTIAVRDKHIRDMVCPVCSEPDINDPEHLNSYFSTLDIQKCGVAFNIDVHPGTQTGVCGVIEQKDDGTRQTDSACGAQTQPGQAGLCEKHYREYLVSLINGHSIDPAPLFDANELLLACRRYQVELIQGEAEEDRTYYARLLKKLMDEVPLGDKVPRKK